VKIAEIKQVETKFLIIDQAAFKYYLGAELDNFMDAKAGKGEQTINKRDLDHLYFNILERLEPYAKKMSEMIDEMKEMKK
jgi:hypothetical protein